ncbi:MAG: aminoacetone oxidase family FAD-binding enzyme [Ruminococcus sp.]|nr:aminoacetone oxidase family FAD-binding enzyme [Ruminococcus sp.]
MKNYIYDVVIVGGGASGLMCAISAKQNNKYLKIAIIEKNERVGKKLLATGNGRCNLTNRNVGLKKYKGSFVNSSKYIFEKYSCDKILQIFKEIGLLSFADSDGRYYPVSRQASSVLDVLRFACERYEIDIFCGETIKSIKKLNNNFNITTQQNTFNSKKIVIACGSKASPKLGGNASAVDYLKNFGHTFVPFSPTLCPIKVKSDILKSIKGLRSLCTATLIDSKGNSIKTESGEVQFNENNISGICIFNLSLYSLKNNVISLDLLPDSSFNDLFFILKNQKKLFSNLSKENILTGILQKRIAQAILKYSNIKDFSGKCSELSENELKTIAKSIKNFSFTIIENAGFEQAQCASGGVKGSEIDCKTMESKKVKNLYIAGEAVDICGECGGYNLHFAFASGHLIGENL